MSIFYNNYIVTSIGKNSQKYIGITMLLFVLIIFWCNYDNKHPTISWEGTTLELGAYVPELFFEDNVWMPKYTSGDNNWYSLYLGEETLTYSGLSIYLDRNKKVRGISFSFGSMEQVSEADLKLRLNNRIIEFNNILPGEYFEDECFYSKVQLAKYSYKINIYDLSFSKKDYCVFN